MTIQVKPETIDECIMGNQGKMERNSKICKKVQNGEKNS